MDHQGLQALERIAARLLGEWWQDERRNWCAYCGVHLVSNSSNGGARPDAHKTRDHIIPSHLGGSVTIPACHRCNVKKGGRTLHEFRHSKRFKSGRKNANPSKWSEADLLAADGIAALRLAAKLYHSAPTVAVQNKSPQPAGPANPASPKPSARRAVPAA